jgi:hypothetical protein
MEKVMARKGSASVVLNVFDPPPAELSDGTLWVRVNGGSIGIGFDSRPGKVNHEIDQLAQLGAWLSAAHEQVQEAIRSRRIPLATSRSLDTSRREVEA